MSDILDRLEKLSQAHDLIGEVLYGPPPTAERLKEQEDDRYLTTIDGQVFDRLHNRFLADNEVEPINTYEKLPSP